VGAMDGAVVAVGLEVGWILGAGDEVGTDDGDIDGVAVTGANVGVEVVGTKVGSSVVAFMTVGAKVGSISGTNNGSMQ
jgi:hypothetical protein